MTEEKRKSSRLMLGIALLFLGFLIIEGQREIIPSSSFETEPVKISGLSGGEVKSEKLPKRIIIPEVSIDLEVKVAKVIGGYWEVFSDAAGWGEGSGVPGKMGNQVIFAHAKEGLFLPLRRVEKGVRVYVLTDEDWYIYEVGEIKEVFSKQIEVIAETQNETLTLYTCSGFQVSKRLIIIAKRLS